MHSLSAAIQALEGILSRERHMPDVAPLEYKTYLQFQGFDDQVITSFLHSQMLYVRHDAAEVAGVFGDQLHLQATSGYIARMKLHPTFTPSRHYALPLSGGYQANSRQINDFMEALGIEALGIRTIPHSYHHVLPSVNKVKLTHPGKFLLAITADPKEDGRYAFAPAEQEAVSDCRNKKALEKKLQEATALLERQQLGHPLYHLEPEPLRMQSLEKACRQFFWIRRDAQTGQGELVSFDHDQLMFYTKALYATAKA
jgi:hypothetical protein